MTSDTTPAPTVNTVCERLERAQLFREASFVRGQQMENARLRVALQCAQKTFADIGNRDRVDEIEDALNPGWRERWT